MELIGRWGWSATWASYSGPFMLGLAEVSIFHHWVHWQKKKRAGALLGTTLQTAILKINKQYIFRAPPAASSCTKQSRTTKDVICSIEHEVLRSEKRRSRRFYVYNPHICNLSWSWFSFFFRLELRYHYISPPFPPCNLWLKTILLLGLWLLTEKIIFLCQ